MRSIRRLLVANRGEIAVRIMRTAHEMGVETVAVYSDADSASPHVAMAACAVCIGPPQPAKSYLDIGKIIEAARRSGADALHPAYGFLSENAAFARACDDAGLIFVGPSAEAIEIMGDKARAKQFMTGAGLPCVPGYEGADQDDDVLIREADLIGYPVIVKAKAGGGGRGMRVVERADQFSTMLTAARREAMNAFGDDRMMIERFVRNPRHVEVQVLVDEHGNGVHFGERDCSVQRRHQKLIEEAPAPGISDELRDRLGAVSVAAAIKLGYRGVGTFEFLLEGDEQFYFMEMNTRLQVEHPVTEAIVGQDLVAWQLRVAMGERLPLRQQDIGFAGHSIEARLCAEDEANGFMPQSGTLELWEPSASIRVDHAMRSGGEVSPFYDSMFAKLIASGRDREEARRKLVMALRETVAFGIRTNREALVRILEHPAFVDGGVHTGFLEAHQASLQECGEDEMDTLAGIAASILCRAESTSALQGHSLLVLRDQHGGEYSVQVSRTGDRYAVKTDDRVAEFVLSDGTESGRYLVGTDGLFRPVRFHQAGEVLFLQTQGYAVSFEDITYTPARSAASDFSDGRVIAQLNGQLVEIMVAVGDVVEAGAPVATVEAMKMAHTHTAPIAGMVETVSVAAGDFVKGGQVIIKIAFGAPAAPA